MDNSIISNYPAFAKTGLLRNRWCCISELKNWRSGTEEAANGAAVVPIVVVGRIDIAGAAEVEVVGVGAVRTRGRRPVVAVVAGVVEQVAGILIDVAAPQAVTENAAKKEAACTQYRP